MLTANYEYCLSNRENLPLPIQILLSEKPKTLILNILKKINGPHSSSIFEVIDSERRGYLNA